MKIHSPAKRVATMGIMLGVVIVLTTLEHMLIVPFMPPHAKPGLANIVIMYCVFVVGGKHAFALNCLKSLAVLATRGAVAGLLSLSGGIVSVTVIILLAGVKKRPIGYALISVAGAVAHNLAQFAAVIFLTAAPRLVYYIPVLVITGIVAGLITGALLTLVMPVLTKLHVGQWGKND